MLHEHNLITRNNRKTQDKCCYDRKIDVALTAYFYFRHTNILRLSVFIYINTISNHCVYTITEGSKC